MSNKIRILHFSTHNEECGIAKYNEQLVDAMTKIPEQEADNTFFDVSPNITRFMNPREFDDTLNRLIQMARNHDILHIQHELSFFKHQELKKILSAAQSEGIRTIVTVHTAPNVQLQPTRLGGLGPRSVMLSAKARRFNRNFINRYFRPLTKASLVLVPNNITKESIESLGVGEINIKIFTHPIPELSFKTKSTSISDALRTSSSDVIYCTVGFISRAKGVDHAIKALNFLPKNYKLAIIGGSHPKGESHEYYDEISDLIVHNKLQDRVLITGYVEDDDSLNALIRETDICTYPYDAQYYGYVSSASLNNAIANYKPAVAYPTKSFLEVNQQMEVLSICDSPNYYELAKTIQTLDREHYGSRSKEFSHKFSATQKAKELRDIYEDLLKS